MQHRGWSRSCGKRIQDGGRPPFLTLRSWKSMQIFYIPYALWSWSACSCKISSRSDERLRSYCKFSISNMAAVRHLEFMKYANFDIPHGLRLKSVYLYKISSRSVERLQSYYKLNISNMAAVRNLGFDIWMPGTSHDAALMVRRSHENFVQIGWIVFEI